MFTLLAAFGGLVGLIFLVLSLLALRTLITLRSNDKGGRSLAWRDSAERKRVLLRWNRADALLLFPAAFAFLFLLVDVIAVLRDRSLFPDYHLGYLLSGLALFLLSFGYLYIRLMLALGLSREAGAAHQLPDPAQAEHPE
ncbi:hypothetical protein [Gorillibacterium sp. CAU 1737]|uniref:hypothetical protein n=1 Tax=Gorillibacterium sp. CAU 1737 TaxID=3140362 RepID=UPI00326195D0